MRPETENLPGCLHGLHGDTLRTSEAMNLKAQQCAQLEHQLASGEWIRVQSLDKEKLYAADLEKNLLRAFNGEEIAMAKKNGSCLARVNSGPACILILKQGQMSPFLIQEDCAENIHKAEQQQSNTLPATGVHTFPDPKRETTNAQRGQGRE